MKERIGGVTLPCGIILKNKYAKSSSEHENLIGDIAFNLSIQHFLLYEKWCQTGIGLCVTSDIFVDSNVLKALQDAEAEKRNNSVARLQYCWSLTSSNAIILPRITHSGWKTLKTASISDIETMRSQFASTASILHQSGFQGIQIQAGNHQLLHQFLSLSTNGRKDNYGGSVPNRMRLLLEIVKEIRSTLGPKFLISVSFSLHYPTIDYTPISLPELLEMIELLVQTRHIDILELDIRKYPFYLTNEQFAKTFAGFSQIGSQKQVSEKFDFQFLKNVHYLCHQSSCRFMLSARDGDSGTPELYHSFFNECCDILAYSDIFYSLDWIQSCVRKDSRSTFSMNGTYSRWYLIYILGGRIHSSDNFDSYFTSIINFFFHNQYSGLLFQQAYCNLLLNQIIDPPSDTHHALYSHQLSLVGFFQLLQTVLSILCRRLGCDKYSTIVNIFFFSLLISSFLSLAFVLWVLIEVTTK